jgi:hypothetical protein
MMEVAGENLFRGELPPKVQAILCSVPGKNPIHFYLEIEVGAAKSRHS